MERNKAGETKDAAARKLVCPGNNGGAPLFPQVRRKRVQETISSLCLTWPSSSTGECARPSLSLSRTGSLFRVNCIFSRE